MPSISAGNSGAVLSEAGARVFCSLTTSSAGRSAHGTSELTTQFYLEHENLETESGHRFARDAALDPRRILHREHITSGPAKGPPSVSGESQWEKPKLPRHPKEPGGGARPIRRQPSSPSERSTRVRNDQLAYLSMKKLSVSANQGVGYGGHFCDHKEGRTCCNWCCSIIPSSSGKPDCVRERVRLAEHCDEMD